MVEIDKNRKILMMHSSLLFAVSLMGTDEDINLAISGNANNFAYLIGKYHDRVAFFMDFFKTVKDSGLLNVVDFPGAEAGNN